MAADTTRFEPDYAVAPGEILEEYLDAFSMTQKELSDRIGITTKHINEIIKGKAALTPDTALKLGRVFDRPAHFWSNLEMHFQQDKARLEEGQKQQLYLEWLKKVPVNKMARLGWIKKYKDKLDQLNEVLNFFGVSSPEQWGIVWKTHQVAYRQSERFETHAEAVSAWLRKGEIEALKIPCATYDNKHFQHILLNLKALTLEPPEVFVPQTKKLCADAGVAVVFVPELPKTGVSGATRWIGGKPVIQLSLRYKTDDHLWFTFLHEAGHILKHGKKEIFLESSGIDGEKEEEANTFAKEFLIPQRQFDEFLGVWDKSLAQIKSFAEVLGVAPGIVVGRLQHDRYLPFTYGNHLKKHFEWSN